jgi:hypothetical protein
MAYTPNNENEKHCKEMAVSIINTLITTGNLSGRFLEIDEGSEKATESLKNLICEITDAFRTA